MEKEKICCICGKPFHGWGNNPWPVAPLADTSGKENSCCDMCNVNVVIAARLAQMKKNA